MQEHKVMILTHRLAITLPHGPGEAPTAYVSRLAMINGQSAKVFSEHQGFDLQDIVQGDRKVLCALAVRTGADMDGLVEASYRLTDVRHYEHKGLVLPRHAVISPEIRGCPACLREDARRSDLTPPVALACFAAAPMAKTSGLKISLQATKLAVAGFVVPFMAVYTPALMLQDGGPIAETYGYAVEVIYVFTKACLGIALWGIAVVGFLFGPALWWERVIAFAAGVSLILAVPLTDEIGLALAVLFFAVHGWRTRGRARAGVT